MCDFITPTVLAATALATSAAAGVASTVQAGATASAGAAAARQSGQVARSQAEWNAQRTEAQVQSTREAAQADEARQRERTRFILGDQRASYGASGVLLEGSPQEVLAMTAAQQELDALTIRYNAGVREADLRGEAASSRYTGELRQVEANSRANTIQAEGRSQQWAGALRTTSTLLTAGAKFF